MYIYMHYQESELVVSIGRSNSVKLLGPKSTRYEITVHRNNCQGVQHCARFSEWEGRPQQNGHCSAKRAVSYEHQPFYDTKYGMQSQCSICGPLQTHFQFKQMSKFHKSAASSTYSFKRGLRSYIFFCRKNKTARQSWPKGLTKG